jgi:asparagine synthase (glutamine-hydrolysing)
MCGIAGLVNWGDREILSRMTALLAHRGPDDSGIWEHLLPEKTWIGLGNRRLSILDLTSAGHMPMSNDDGTLTISYNGEVYNAAELRERLTAKGYRFRSRTDTEVVLKMYEEYGPACLKDLNGMFAFAIVDQRRERLFLARDHFGVKPLYYIHRGHQLAFASEIKSFLAIPDFDLQVSPEALQQYLTFLWVPEPLTMFEGVLKLPPGHFAIFRRGEFRIEQYWNLTIPGTDAAYTHSEEELVEAVRAELARSVRQQMRSDVPVGAFLSGGLDSSCIVSMMKSAGTPALKTYSISFAARDRVGENTLDDPQIAQRFAGSLGCEHHEIEVSAQTTSLLEKLAYQMDEPTADPAVVTAYLVCQHASRDCTVLLSGVGGDEVFGGYRKYAAHHWSKLYCAIPASVRNYLIEPAFEAMPAMRNSPMKGWVRLAKKMARSASLGPQQAAAMNMTYMNRDLREELCSSPKSSGTDPWETLLQHFEPVSEADFLHQLMYLDFKTFLPSLNLAYTDKMSMANSVEVRVPFLDRQMVDLVFREVPPQLKVHGQFRSTLKYILRKAMADCLPSEVLNAPKAGFGAPIDLWLARDLGEMTNDLLCERRIRERGFFEFSVIERFLHEHRSGRADWSFQIWQLLTFELWAQAFLDCPRSAAMSDVRQASTARA